MNLKQQIDNDIKDAMKSQSIIKRDALRFIKSEISRAEGGLKTYEDKEIISLIKKAIENLRTINKPESLEEISILEAYLPTQLSEEKIREIIKIIITETGASSAKEMGKVMGKFNLLYAGQADGKIVSQIVKETLS